MRVIIAKGGNNMNPAPNTADTDSKNEDVPNENIRPPNYRLDLQNEFAASNFMARTDSINLQH